MLASRETTRPDRPTDKLYTQEDIEQIVLKYALQYNAFAMAASMVQAVVLCTFFYLLWSSAYGS